MIGKTIGNYRIVEKLGKGATGTVFKAIDETLGRDVAIKVLHADVAQSDVMKRFRTEVKALANLNHAEIATIHDVQVTSEGVLVVTELVRGETLDALTKRVGPLPPERAGLLIAQILSALAHAHAVGVVHRDLKPASVIVTELGTVKLLDFAMAPVEGASQMTAASFAIGTPAFMAPERILGNEVDARADVYSVGGLFYALLTGKLPFEAPSATEMVQKQLAEPPVPVRTHRPDLPQWCEDVLTHALAKSPVDRFQTVDEFRAAVMDGLAAASGAATGVHHSVVANVTAANAPPVRPPTIDADAATLMVASPLETGQSELSADAVLPSAALPMPIVDPNAATFLAAIPPDVLQRQGDDVAATMIALNTVTMASSQLTGAASDVGPTVAMPQGAIADAGAGDLPTMLAPVAAAPTVAAQMAVPAPTAMAPAVSSPTGTTLVMERKQFAAAGVILGLLALGVVVLAVVVLRRPATSPAPDGNVAVATPAPVSAPPSAPVTPAEPPPTAPAGTPPAAAAPPPPVEISEPTLRTAPPEVPRASASVSPARGVPATPAPVATPNPNLARITDSSPFKFEAKAIVVDGDRRRERDASVLLADGAISVNQTDGKPLYSLSISNLTQLTYSNSRQPLWNSPAGTAEAMRVEGGGFGFGRGRRNWFGLQTPDSLLVVRVDDEIVGRVIGGLQERTGLPVVRLIEPKE